MTKVLSYDTFCINGGGGNRLLKFTWHTLVCGFGVHIADHRTFKLLSKNNTELSQTGRERWDNSKYDIIIYRPDFIPNINMQENRFEIRQDGSLLARAEWKLRRKDAQLKLPSSLATVLFAKAP